MNVVLLALHITCTNGVAQVRAVTPGAGSWSVQASDDLHSWRVLAAGHCTNAVHISAREAQGACRFYRVEFR